MAYPCPRSHLTRHRTVYLRRPSLPTPGGEVLARPCAHRSLAHGSCCCLLSSAAPAPLPRPSLQESVLSELHLTCFLRVSAQIAVAQVHPGPVTAAHRHRPPRCCSRHRHRHRHRKGQTTRSRGGVLSRSSFCAWNPACAALAGSRAGSVLPGTRHVFGPDNCASERKTGFCWRVMNFNGKQTTWAAWVGWEHDVKNVFVEFY